MESIESWAEEELKQVNLGDQRMNTRFKELINQFSKNPQASINHALEDWTSTKAAYRFFKNEKVSEKNILASHIQNTVSRCKKHKFVLVLQDTCVVSYASHEKTKGLGIIGGDARTRDRPKGINMHTALAITPQGMPLGVLENTLWTRKYNPQSRQEKRRKDDQLLLAEKESYKWVHTLEQCSRSLSGTNFITIADKR